MKSENCNCIREISISIRKNVEELKKDDKSFKINSINWNNRNYFPFQRFFAVVNIHYQFDSVNDKAPREEMGEANVVYSFCPFCGVAYHAIPENGRPGATLSERKFQ